MPIPFQNRYMPETPQPAEVDTPTASFLLQYRDLRPCQDLMGGTEAMRRAAGAYIPREPGEHERHHRDRIARTVLRNVFKQTIQYDRGQVFAKEISLDNSDELLSEDEMNFFSQWKENVDQRGKNLSSWAGDVFQQGLVDGVTFCLVDYPSIETQDMDGIPMYRDTSGQWRQRTVAADRREGWLPYLVHVKADQMLDCRSEWRDGKRVITHMRYIETTTEDDPANVWGQNIVQYIRAYWLDHWELWRKRETETGFSMIAQGQMSLDEIPLVIFMPGDKRTEFTAQPALMDLAWLNIRHWQATCEQYDLMSYVRRPPWYIIGLDPNSVTNSDGQGENAVFGPGHVLYLPVGSAMGSAGVDPGSVEAGRSDLKDIEEAMAAYGLQILQRPSQAGVTATQVQRESRENNSILKNWALDFQDFLENCLRLVGRWQGFPDGPNVKVNDEFAANANVDYLLQLHDKGLISKETLATLMKRSGILPDDFSFEDETARLVRDAGTSANAGQSFTTRLSTFLSQSQTRAQPGQGQTQAQAPAQAPISPSRPQ